MKLYTRGGDEGETGLFGGGRIAKDDLRVEAFGEVDELNAALGFALVPLEKLGATSEVERLRTIQEDLFALGAHLATPAAPAGTGAARHLPPLPLERIARMEEWIDEADAALPPLRNFILPGGTEAAARLHLARAICRRSERRVVALGAVAGIEPGVVAYLNRLSDVLFILARLANQRAGRDDELWQGRS